MQTPYWKTAATSVRGAGHEQAGTPCQDACSVLESEDRRWVALVASDGAGSAKHAEVSSALVASDFANALIELAKELDSRPPGAWATDAVIEEIVRLRKILREKAGSDNISDYHCTLVAALLGPTGGFTIHLGDGAVFGGVANASDESRIDLSGEYVVSEPENGEYANETVFLTERDWIKHLRIQPLPRMGWLILGTDGGMALAMHEEKTPKTGFVVPVLRGLISHDDSEARNGFLEKILTDRQADRLTNDDKTLVVAQRSTGVTVDGEFQLPATKTSAKPPAPSPTLPPAMPHDKTNTKKQTANCRPKSIIPTSKSQEKEGFTTSLKPPRRMWVVLSVAVLVLLAVLIFGIWHFFMKPATGKAGIKKPTGATTGIAIDKKNKEPLMMPKAEKSKEESRSAPPSHLPDSAERKPEDP